MEQIFLLCESGVSITIRFILDNYPGVLDMINDRRTIFIGETKMELSPLQIAVACGHIDVILLLLELETIDVNVADPLYTMTALHLAVHMGQATALEALCRDRRLKFDEKTLEGKTALHLAVEQGFASMVEIILRLHPTVDLRTRDFEGNSVLHLAAYRPNLRVVGLLLNHASLVNLYSESFEPLSKERAAKKARPSNKVFEVQDQHTHLTSLTEFYIYCLIMRSRR